jgi:hypothetical protein
MLDQVQEIGALIGALVSDVIMPGGIDGIT